MVCEVRMPTTTSSVASGAEWYNNESKQSEVPSGLLAMIFVTMFLMIVLMKFLVTAICICMTRVMVRVLVMATVMAMMIMVIVMTMMIWIMMTVVMMKTSCLPRSGHNNNMSTYYISSHFPLQR